MTAFIRDFWDLNIFGVNSILQVLGLQKVASTYDVDLVMVKDALEKINPENCSAEQLLAFKYYVNIKRRRTEHAIQDYRFFKVCL